MTAVSYLRLTLAILAVAALAGAVAALGRHEPYLASRLTAFCGAVAFASLRAQYIVATSRAHLKESIGMGVLLGLVLLLVIILLLVPDRFFRVLAWLAGNPHAPTPL